MNGGRSVASLPVAMGLEIQSGMFSLGIGRHHSHPAVGNGRDYPAKAHIGIKDLPALAH
jgi:hypothetical protein